MSPTFRSLRNPNYRRYVTGSVVSNTGTWMQRVAQDWLVLSLGGGGAALGITTGLQFLPVLLLSPYAGVIADRFPKRRLLQVTQAMMAVSALVLGLIAVLGVARDLARLRAGFRVRHRRGVRRAGPPVLRLGDGRRRRRDERRRAQLGGLQPGPHPGARPGRPDDRPARWRRRGHRLGDPDQRRVLPRGDLAARTDGHRVAPHRRAATRAHPACSEKVSATSAVSRRWC